MLCQFNLNIVFLDPKDDKKALLAAAHSGISGATVLYGLGTNASKLLSLLGIDQLRKEIMLLVAHESATDTFHKELYKALELDKHGHGLVVTAPLNRVLGLKELNEECWKGDGNMDYELITIIVDNGLADDIVAAARKGGAKGATTLRGHGTASSKAAKFFNLEIEPEKKIVLIVAPSDQVEVIISSVRAAHEFEGPNSGVLFSMDLSKVTGLFKGEYKGLPGSR